MGRGRPDYGAMVKDLEILDRSADRLTLVFWMPAEFGRTGGFVQQLAKGWRKGGLQMEPGSDDA